MPDNLSGAIIAAGRGERLRPATGALPKPLVEVGGETLLERQVRLMIAVGLARIHVIVNSETAGLMEQKRMTLPDQVALQVANTPNSMESLLRLGEAIPAGRFLLTTVDTIADETEFRSFFARAQDITSSAGNAGGYEGALGVVEWSGDKKPLFVRVSSDDQITRFDDPEQKIVTAGVYFLSTRVFAHALEARARKLDALRRYLALVVERGHRLAAVRMKDVMDIDEPADLELARRRETRRISGGRAE